MSLYALLGRLLHPFAMAGMYVYSSFTHTPRARLVVFNENGEVLLVRSWLGGRDWGLPGGGMEQGEDAVSAAVRELKEETGIVVNEAAVHHVFNLRSSGHDEQVCRTEASGNSLPDELPSPFEIQQAAWYSLDALPPVQPLVKDILQRIKELP